MPTILVIVMMVAALMVVTIVTRGDRTNIFNWQTFKTLNFSNISSVKRIVCKMGYMLS